MVEIKLKSQKGVFLEHGVDEFYPIKWWFDFR